MNDPMPGLDRSQEVGAAWKAAAEELGGDYGIAATVDLPWLQRRWAGGRITVVLVRVGHAVHTRLRAPFVDSGTIVLTVRGESMEARLRERLGGNRDLQVGSPVFDERFRVRGHPEDRVRAVLAPPIPERLLRDPTVVVEVSAESEDVSYPHGISELVVEYPEVVDRTDRLVDLVGLAEALLLRLERSSPGGESDVDGWAARLARPGGRRVDPWRDLVLWDGDEERREAARSLGATGDPAAIPALIGILDDPDSALVLEAVAGLEALGGSDAVPDLVARLGRRAPSVDGVTIPARIAQALRSLGEDRLVDAFEAALDGDAAQLVAEAGRLRDPVVTALLDIVGSFDLDDRVPAAKALGELGDRRALDLLRKKAGGAEAPTPLTEACRVAADRIEALG